MQMDGRLSGHPHTIIEGGLGDVFVLFSFRSITLAFSLCRLWRRTILSYLAYPRAGSRWQRPRSPKKKNALAKVAPRKLQRGNRTRTKGITQGIPKSRSPQVTTPLAPPLRPPPPPLHLRCPNFPPPVEPFSRHWYFARSLGPAAPGCTCHPPAEVTHVPLLLSLLRLLLDPRHRSWLVFPLVTVLEEVASRLVSITIVLRVAPPAVVVRSVFRALQVHART